MRAVRIKCSSLCADLQRFRLYTLLLFVTLPLQVEAGQPQGWFYQLFVDRDLWQDHRINIYGRVQAGLMYNDNSSDNLFPTGFFNLDEGFILNRTEIIVEKPLRTTYKPRIGPFPGLAPENWDWGFLVQGRYGQDFSRTYGFDDELNINENERRVFILPQWFVKAYAPWGGELHSSLEPGLPILAMKLVRRLILRARSTVMLTP